MVLGEEAQSLVQVVQRFGVLFFKFLLFNLPLLFLLALEKLIALFFGSLILLLHLLILFLQQHCFLILAHRLHLLLFLFFMFFLNPLCFFFLFGLLIIDHFL